MSEIHFIPLQDSQQKMQENPIQVLELRRLLYELKDQQPDICVRFRLLGEKWQASFMRVSELTEEGVVLFNENNNQAIAIKDLREIVQFEVDARYQNYQPHNHYNVQPAMNVTERNVGSGSR
jgi:hypothetical protein